MTGNGLIVIVSQHCSLDCQWYIIVIIIFIITVIISVTVTDVKQVSLATLSVSYSTLRPEINSSPPSLTFLGWDNDKIVMMMKMLKMR